MDVASTRLYPRFTSPLGKALFAIQLLLSFLIGGLWVTLATVMAQRWGTRIGGTVAGLPSTVVVAFVFIALSQGTRQAYLATEVFPLTFSFNAFAVAAYAALARHGLAAALTGFVLTWLTLQASLVAITRGEPPAALGPSLLAAAVVLVATTLGFRKWLPAPFATGATQPIGLRPLLGRGIFSGLVISAAVLAAAVNGPLAGSVVAAFPAVFITTLSITARAEGIEFSRSLCLPLMLSGMVNCITFASTFHLLVLHCNLVLTLVGALLATACSAVCVDAYLRKFGRSAP